MAVHGKADAGDIAVLFPTQEVAGAADFQVTHGNLEARAEFGEFLDGLQAFFGDFRQDLVAAVEEIGIGHAMAPTDAAAHLIELGQAEVVGVVNDDGIGIGYVQAVFRPNSRQEDYMLPCRNRT